MANYCKMSEKGVNKRMIMQTMEVVNFDSRSALQRPKTMETVNKLTVERSFTPLSAIQRNPVIENAKGGWKVRDGKVVVVIHMPIPDEITTVRVKINPYDLPEFQEKLRLAQAIKDEMTESDKEEESKPDGGGQASMNLGRVSINSLLCD